MWTLKCHKISFIPRYDESNKSINGHDHWGGWANNKSAWFLKWHVIYFYDIINHLWQVRRSDAQTRRLIGWSLAPVYLRKMRSERPESSLNWLLPVCSHASSVVMAPWGQIKSLLVPQLEHLDGSGGEDRSFVANSRVLSSRAMWRLNMQLKITDL